MSTTGFHSASVVLRRSNDVLTLTPWQGAEPRKAARRADRAGVESLLRPFMNDDFNRLAIMRLCHEVEPGYTLAGAPASASAVQHMAGLIAAGKVLVARNGDAAQYADGQFPFSLRQLAYLPAGGPEVNGSYFLRGHYTVQGRTITVSAEGRTSARQVGPARFFASVRTAVDGQPGGAHPLARGNPGDMPEDDYTSIGTAQWELPEVRHGQSVALMLTAGYTFDTPTGQTAPMPAAAEREILLALR